MTSITDVMTRLGGNPAWTDNWTLGGLDTYGELMNTADFGIWLSVEPISREEYVALVVPGGFRKSGVGRSAHDAAFFSRSPGATTNGPVETMAVGNHHFSLVARPGRRESGFDQVMVLPVTKHHRVYFAGGRTLEAIDLGDGTFLLPQATGASLGDAPEPEVGRTLPEGWATRTFELADDLVVDIPTPARVAIFSNGDIFHGPLPGSKIEELHQPSPDRSDRTDRAVG